MRRPPLGVVFVAVLMVALGETTGAFLGPFRAQLEDQARRRVLAAPATHGLAGTPEYDQEVVRTTVFAFEAGLSFLHTHAQGLGPVALLTATLVATAVPARRLRAVLYALVTLGALFPLGYLFYALAVLELGREAGVASAERWLLTPLGSAAILALLLLAVTLAGRRTAG